MLTRIYGLELYPRPMRQRLTVLLLLWLCLAPVAFAVEGRHEDRIAGRVQYSLPSDTGKLIRPDAVSIAVLRQHLKRAQIKQPFGPDDAFVVAVALQLHFLRQPVNRHVESKRTAPDRHSCCHRARAPPAIRS